jgi:hypothetical protein
MIPDGKLPLAKLPGGNQSGSAAKAGAPLAYNPFSVKPTVQARSAAPKAPPVYRPEAPKIMQLKPAVASSLSQHGAPPVYRPSQPKIMQLKAAGAVGPNVRVAAPPVYRPGMMKTSAASIQRRPVAGSVPIFSGMNAPAVLQRKLSAEIAEQLEEYYADDDYYDDDDYGEDEDDDGGYAEYVEANYATADPATGRQHAYARHTYEGIYANRALGLLTAHPTQVAIFATVADLDTAIQNMPTLKTDWVAGAGGRYDAQIGNIHYQGTLLGDAMSLFSVYPTNRNYVKATVTGHLGAASLAAFKLAVG